MKIQSFILLSILSINCYADQVNVECQDSYFNAGEKHNKLYGEGNFAVFNDSGTTQRLTYTITICSPIGECKSKTAIGTSIPNALYVSPGISMIVSSNFGTYGSYNFKVTLDVSGFKTLHGEKQCIMRIVR